MKTQDLIGLLASDSLQTQAPVRQQLRLPLLMGGVACTALLLVFWGLNPRMNTMAVNPAFITKMLWLASLVGFSAYGLLRLARPGVSAGHTFAGMGLSLLAMGTLGLLQLVQADAGERSALWMGTSWQVCSPSIAALSLPVLGNLLWALRQLAPTRAALTGAVAGVMASSVAASIYSLYCTETSFAFFAIWYVAGMASVTLIGAVLGQRCLRW